MFNILAKSEITIFYNRRTCSRGGLVDEKMGDFPMGRLKVKLSKNKKLKIKPYTFSTYNI